MLENLAIGFVVGIFAGIGLFTVFFIHRARQIVKDIRGDIKQKESTTQKDNKRAQQDIEEKKKLTEIVTAKLEEAGRIIEAQNNIAGALQQPSQNALHSKHKNKLVSDWKILEERKQSLFHSILSAGADPIVNVYDDNIKKTREMKLSELMQIMGSHTLPIEDTEQDKKLKKDAGQNATIKKVTKNGKTFHLIENKGNKTEH